MRHNLVSFAIITSLTAVSLSLFTPKAYAQASDPAGDFLGTYLGDKGGDLDVLSTGAVYTGSSFIFTATLNGVVGSTNGGFYVWGVNKGNGAAGFAGLGLSNVLFDATVIVRPNGTNTLNATANVGANQIANSSISFSGNSLSVIVPAAFLPSTGFAPDKYTINLWPRASFVAGTTTALAGNAAISDFAPNNANVAVTAAPEPGSLSMVFVGSIGMLGSLLYIKRNHRKK